MNPDRLYDDFAFAVRCESRDTVVFVACPRGGRYGDVRKTLAGLLQRPFATISVAPYDEHADSTSTTTTSTTVAAAAQLPTSSRLAGMATKNSASAAVTTPMATATSSERGGGATVDVAVPCGAMSPVTPYDDAAVVPMTGSDADVVQRVQIVVRNEHGAWVRL